MKIGDFNVVVHRAGKSSWNAYVPELEGVVAVAGSRERVIELIAEAIPFHLGIAKERDLTRDGLFPAG